MGITRQRDVSRHGLWSVVLFPPYCVAKCALPTRPTASSPSALPALVPNPFNSAPKFPVAFIIRHIHITGYAEGVIRRALGLARPVEPHSPCPGS